MEAVFDTTLKKLPAEFLKLATEAPEKIPKGSYLVRAKAPWQTLLWAILRWWFAVATGFLSAAPFLGVGAPSVGQITVSIVFAALTVFLVVRGAQKLKEWRAYTRRFLLFTPEHFIERKERRATVVPWEEIKNIKIIPPDSDKGIPDPLVKFDTAQGAYVIVCGRALSLVTGTTSSVIYAIVPGAMAFSPEPAYYTEGAFAIKRKMEEYLHLRKGSA